MLITFTMSGEAKSESISTLEIFLSPQELYRSSKGLISFLKMCQILMSAFIHCPKKIIVLSPPKILEKCQINNVVFTVYIRHKSSK